MEPEKTILVLEDSDEDFDTALEAAKKAVTFPEGAKEGERMLKAIEDAINERTQKMKL